MAQQISTQQHFYQYKDLTLLKHQTLGQGSYGVVYKAKCDQLTCAAKVLHSSTGSSASDRCCGAKTQWREYEFLTAMCHPHVVQYLGICTEPGSGLPVLLMELVDESLTVMLEHSPSPLCYHVQVNLCHGIALALAYLHCSGIPHWNLSSNNVLVYAGTQAKVTDFGMSKVAGSDFHQTRCPVYMPPEVVQKQPPTYTENVDIFSEGVIMIQVCTRIFPNPGPATKDEKDPQSPTGTHLVPVSERDRRRDHIDLIDPTHPLRLVATECLENREEDRPTDEELCQRLAALKENPKYLESMTSCQDASVAARTTQTMAEEQQVRSLRNQVQELNQKLESNERVVAKFQDTTHQLHVKIKELESENADLKRQLGVMPAPLAEGSPAPAHQIDMKWRDGSKAPFADGRGSSIVDRNVAYFVTVTGVYSYDLVKDSWSVLPKCPQVWGSLAVVQGLLTMVGGMEVSVTNKLVSLSRKKDQGWSETFPPMPTKRCYTTATVYLNHLIVAGGSTITSGQSMDTVEVLNMDTSVWSTLASLPHSVSRASSALCGVHLYLLGGADTSPSRSVFTSNVTELLRTSRSDVEQIELGQKRLEVWQCAADAPVYYSTCAVVCGQLLAIGGFDDNKKKKNAIFKYDAMEESWEVISHMTTDRSSCYVVNLIDANKLMVVCGRLDDGTATDVVEIAVY